MILREHFPLAGLGWRVGFVILFGAIGMAIGPEVAGRLFSALGSYSWGFVVGVGANVVNLAIVGALKVDSRGFVPEFSVFATNPF